MAENDPAPVEKSKPVDEVDALAAMASGADLNEVDPYLEEAAKAEGVADEGDAATAAPIPAIPQVMTTSAAPVSRAAAAKKKQQQASAVYAQQYKSVMIPLLLVVGAMLVGIALVCFFFSGDIQKDDFGEIISEPLLPRKFQYFGMIAGPMGLILLVGSYLFHMELAKKKKKAAATRK